MGNIIKKFLKFLKIEVKKEVKKALKNNHLSSITVQIFKKNIFFMNNILILIVII